MGRGKMPTSEPARSLKIKPIFAFATQTFSTPVLALLSSLPGSHAQKSSGVEIAQAVRIWLNAQTQSGPQSGVAEHETKTSKRLWDEDTSQSFVTVSRRKLEEVEGVMLCSCTVYA